MHSKPKPRSLEVEQENSQTFTTVSFEKIFFFDNQSNLRASLSSNILPDQGVSEEIQDCYVSTPLRDDIYPLKRI